MSVEETDEEARARKEKETRRKRKKKLRTMKKSLRRQNHNLERLENQILWTAESLQKFQELAVEKVNIPTPLDVFFLRGVWTSSPPELASFVLQLKCLITSSSISHVGFPTRRCLNLTNEDFPFPLECRTSFGPDLFCGLFSPTL